MSATVVRLEFERIDSPVAEALIEALLAEYVVRYGGHGGDQAPPDEFTAPDGAFVIAFVDGTPIGCGGLRRLAAQVGEIKRMYVEPAARGMGVGRTVLRALEQRARASGYATLRLETGARQPEAISLYESEEYLPIEPYGYYRDSPLSRCFEKHLQAPSS
jgi:GNAT superfamily N-acetyltransferase